MTAYQAQGTVTDLTAHLPEGQQGKGKEPAQSTVLLDIGQTAYRYITSGRRIYAVEVDGPAIARPLRGDGSLRQALTRRYALETGRAPSQSALADAVGTLEAIAMDAEDQPISLRVAADPVDPDTTWLDLGRPDARSVCISPDGWAVTSPPSDQGPLWRRTRLVGQMPLPERHPEGWEAGLGLLRELLPVSEEAWPMTVAWLLSALRPDMPRPVAYLTGEQGTGKSTSGRLLLRVIDGIGADLRSTPRTDDDLAVTTAAGWVLALDNLSGIQPWFSDALCRTVTGDAVMKRELYSDDDVSVLTYQRPVLLTGIDVGALRGDLAERMLPIGLEVIRSEERRSERELWTAYRRAHPHILGGLLSLAAQVWERLPDAAAQMATRPRMADWSELLWSLDQVTGWETLRTYSGAQDALVDDVLSSDPVGNAVLRWALSNATPDYWEGTPGQLLDLLPAPLSDRNWPRTAGAFGGRLTRAAPLLRKRGVDIGRKTVRGVRMRTIRVTRDPEG